MAQPIYFIPNDETLGRADLATLQRHKLATMLREILPTNPFYRTKFANIAFNPESDPIERLPFTTRDDLEHDQRQHPPYGTNLTYPLDQYCRLHQTSGSSFGRPMRWLDTDASWKWCQKCWGYIYAAAGVQRGDRLMFPFSFGPFLGFWAAFESAISLGHLSLAAGGMTTLARLRLVADHQVNTICCTPTYAVRMAEVAEEEGIDLAGSSVSRLIVAGEPGGSIAATRSRIASAWGARVFDHTGMTEIGPLGFECEQNPGGVHLTETECIAEVIDPATDQPLPDGEMGELVLTNLGRWASPLIRYRTGDQVRLSRGRCACGRSFARMEGGILGRIDDMFVVRGNNVFPASLEAVIREVPDVAEFRVEVYEEGALAEVRVEVEPAVGADITSLAHRVGRMIHDRLSFRAEVTCVAAGALPRYEMKAKRFVKKRQSEKQRRAHEIENQPFVASVIRRHASAGQLREKHQPPIVPDRRLPHHRTGYPKHER